MTKVRPFERTDIPQLVDLCAHAFPDVRPYPPAEYFEEFFFRNPLAGGDIRPLVSEGADGRIAGFVGVMPRRFLLNGRPVSVAVATRLMVAPEARSTTAGIRLFNAFISGRQDLSCADTCNAPGWAIWQAFRAQTVWPYGVNWQCTLRPTPARSIRNRFNRGGAWRIAGPMAGPVLAAVDEAARRAWRRRHPLPDSDDVSCEETDTGAILAGMPDVIRHVTLRPDYDRAGLDWLIRRAAAKTVNGDLKVMGVRDGKGVLLGWFVYYLKRRGHSMVMQLAARPRATQSVVNCLIREAANGGADSVGGRLEPNLIAPLSARSDISFRLSPYWTVAHSRRPEIMAALHGGRALLSKLDGEWSMAFHGEALEDVDDGSLEVLEKTEMYSVA